MNQTRTQVEGAFSVAIFVCILLVTLYVPVIRIISMWFLPLPMIFYTAKSGWKSGLLALAVALVVSLVIAGPVLLAFAAFFSLLGFVMGCLLHLKKSAFAILLGGSLTSIAMLLLLYGVMMAVFHIDPLDVGKQTLQQSIDIAGKLSASMGQDSKEQIAQLNQFIKMMPYYVPSLIVMGGVIPALIVELVSTPVLRRLRVGFPKWLPFREWLFPRSLIWYYLAALIIMFTAHIQPGDTLYLIVVNAYLLLEVVMAVQGFAFIFYFAHSKKMPKALPIIVAIFSLLIPFLLYIISILGIIDLGFNMRSRLKKK